MFTATAVSLDRNNFLRMASGPEYRRHRCRGWTHSWRSPKRRGR